MTTNFTEFICCAHTGINITRVYIKAQSCIISKHARKQMRQQRTKERAGYSSQEDGLCSSCGFRVDERKKMTMKKNKSSSSARTQAYLYFRFLTEQVVAHVIILFTIVYVYMTMKRYHYRYDSWPTRFITCTEDQPLVKIEENFLNFLEYEKLRKCTLEHPRLNVPSSLSPAAFGKIRGFVSKFNEEGVDSFLNHPDFGDCFGDLFKKMSAPGMNAHVFSAVVCDLSNYDELKN